MTRSLARWIVAVLLLGWGAAGWAAGKPAMADEPPPLVVADGRLVDRQGRTVILRGVNVNQLGDYFVANSSVPATMPLGPDDFRRIAALGLNHVRLLVSWSALEPEPGQVSAGAVAAIRQALDSAHDAGLMVVLDMHQDAWGKHVGSPRDAPCPFPLQPALGWDGAPEWATITDGQERCRLFVRELSAAVYRSWQAFYDNREGLQDHLAAVWGQLAAEFRGHPALAGYDLLNEPGPGERPWNFLAKAQFHRKALAAIRAGEGPGQHRVVFFESFAPYLAVSAEPALPWALDPQVAYAPHLYLGSIGPEWIPLLLGFEWLRADARLFSAAGGQLPVWVGEWGYFGGDPTYPYRFGAIEDAYGFGSAFWQWKQACGDPHGMSWPGGVGPASSGNLVLLRCGDREHPEGVEVGMHADNVRVLSRPYPRRFPGQARFWADPRARVLEVEGSSGAGDAPLEVWVPGLLPPRVTATGLRVDAVTIVPGGFVVFAVPVAPTWRLRTE